MLPMTDPIPSSKTGFLMPIGGSEDITGERVLLDTFTRLCGGSAAHIVLIPSASSIVPKVSAQYISAFKAVGVGEINVIDITSRQQANETAWQSVLNEATGIFVSGGDQLRLISLIGATRLHTAIIERFHAGIHIAGTSAGASAMSRQMIAFGRTGMQPSQRMVQFASGLGLSELIIDQHFRQRKRLGRLLTAIAFNPGMVGIGLDEDTALLIDPDGKGQVLGSGGMTVVDGRTLSHTDVYLAKSHAPFTVRGVDPYTLMKGAHWHL